MKALVLLLFLGCLLVDAAPKEVSAESGQRKVFFDLVRPEVAKQAELKPGSIQFEGSLKQLGNWAFFGGRSLNANLKSLALEPHGNDDTCALFLKTVKGWVLVDWSAGHSDMFYLEWVGSYGMPPELLGLPKDWTGE